MNAKTKVALERLQQADEKGKLAEADWARLFLKLGINFEYEPHFLRFDRVGKSDKHFTGFTPDFFFPDLNVYVEVTVTRHIGRKNKKLTRARKKYPDKHFILLTRHEHRIVFGGEEFPLDPDRIDAWTQVATNLARLVEVLNKGLAQPLTSLCFPPPSVRLY